MQNLSVPHRVTRLAAGASLTVVLATISAGVAPLAGQPPVPHPAPAEPARTPRFASPVLPAGHWAVDAVRRTALVGLAPAEFAWGDGTLTQAAVGWALMRANARARDAASPLHTSIDAEWRRFAREFPAVAERLSRETEESDRPSRRYGSVPVAIAITAGYATAEGRLLPVRSLDRTRENVSSPEQLADVGHAQLEARASTLLGSFGAAELAGGRIESDWQIGDWHALGAIGPVGGWVGKVAPDFGPGTGGGLILDGRASFSGGGLMLVRPVRAPWIFRYLGFIRAEALLSRIDSSAATEHPWVFASRVSLSPHPRLMVGATQAFMFSGEGLPPFTWRNFKEMFLTHAIKVTGEEYENGLASIEARWRPPIPHVPTLLYVEWGADDNHSAWFKFPALVAGIALPSVPAIPALSVGLEHTSFSRPCTGCDGCACEYYATWYRHYVFMDGWTLDRRLIGHPLGGDGSEWLLHGRFDDAARRLRLDGRAFTRRRGPYNLFAPDREGRSVGGHIAAAYRVTAAFELRASGELERGTGDWTASSANVGVRWVP